MPFTIFNKTSAELNGEIRGAGLPVSFLLQPFSFAEFQMHELICDIVFIHKDQAIFFCSDYKISDLNTLIIDCLSDQFLVTEYSNYNPKPVYFMAHQCNEPKDVIESQAAGVNGMEADIWVDEENIPWVSHDNEKTILLSDWIVNSFPNKKKLSLLMLDIKDAASLNPVYEQVVRFKNILPDFTLFSTASTEMSHVFKSISDITSSSEGFCIDEEDDLEKTVLAFTKAGVKNAWFGNGIFSLGPDLPKFKENLKKAAALRDGRNSPIKKTMAWTISSGESMNQYLYECNADALIVEKKDIMGLKKYIESPLIRLAGSTDHAFEVYSAVEGKIISNMLGI